MSALRLFQPTQLTYLRVHSPDGDPQDHLAPNDGPTLLPFPGSGVHVSRSGSPSPYETAAARPRTLPCSSPLRTARIPHTHPQPISPNAGSAATCEHRLEHHGVEYASPVERARRLHQNRCCPECRRPCVLPITSRSPTTVDERMPVPGTGTLLGFECLLCGHFF